MNKIYRILGKHGRVTIPYYLRILMEYVEPHYLRPAR